MITLELTCYEQSEKLFARVSYQDARDEAGPLAPGQTFTLVLSPSSPNDPAHISPKKIRKRATRCEETIAAQLGGRRHKASGSLKYLRGDVRVKGRFRIESKFTRKQGYRVSLETLAKIRSECAEGEVPMLDITWVDPQTTSTLEEWVLVPRSIFTKG